ncbi:MAG: hypothetical protein K2X99_09070 [Gemmatimonadaceae bacterium]|nr:hypothetical protein [Gemmatimonadaceae bacterium]
MIATLAILALLQGTTPDYPAVVRSHRPNAAKPVDFAALLSPDTVYVGQQASYELGVFITQEMRSRLRRNPEFVPPEVSAMLAYDLPSTRPLVGNIDGRPYEVHVFRRALFPLTPGRFVIPAARLSYAVPQSASFFSREETRSLSAPAQVLVAIDPPIAGRPAVWNGAVGRFRTDVVVPDSARAGDPVVLTLVVEGYGNVALVPRPPLAIAGASVVAADERVRIDSTPVRLGGRKEFDWLVTPSRAGALDIAPIAFASFDPDARRYETRQTARVRLTVAPGAVVEEGPDSVASAVAPMVEGPEAPLSLSATLSAPIRAPLERRVWFIALFVLAPLPALGVLWRTRTPRQRRRPLSVAAQLHAATKRARDPTVAEARALFLGAVESRLGVSLGALDTAARRRAFALEGVASDTADRALALLDRLDRAAFGGEGAAPRARDLDDVASAIDREARPGRARLHRAVLLLPMIVALAQAQSADALDRALAAGRAAYAGRDYPRAVESFREAAQRAPGIASVWSDLGTAAWAAHDTATAVYGWQRALRMEPLDGALRDRLQRVGAPQDAGPAVVWPVPRSAAVLLALGAWLALWTLVASRRARRRSLRVTLIVGAPLLALVTAGAVFIARAADGTGLAVVAQPAALRREPMLGAEGGSVPLTGEVARITARQGPWARITLPGDRTGWIALDALLPLGD